MNSCITCVWVLSVTLMMGQRMRCDVQSFGTYAPGNVIIGILGSIHSKVKDLEARIRPDAFTCTDFDLIPFVQSLAAIYTIEAINDSGFLPGIQLGYLMCDSCAYGTKAIECVENMLAVNRTFPVLTEYSNFRSPVKVFLGERYSEVSIPVAKLLNLYMIPQISCTSSSSVLSDKLRYASFFRVIPSDIYQTKALAKVMRYFSWNWIGVVTLDDDYGRPALENFLTDAKNENICIAYQELLPNYLGFLNMDQRIKDVAKKIRSFAAMAVLLILRPELVEMLFKEMVKTNTTRIWIASDAWSTTRYLMNMTDINKVGDIIGLTFLTGNIPGFEDYLQNLRPSPGGRNDFIKTYKELRFNCTSDHQSALTSPLACTIPDPQEANDDYLIHAVNLLEAYSQRVAVYAIAHAIKQLLKCNDTACSGDANLLPWQLVEILRNINFTVDNQTYSFDNHGDFNNGYAIIMWKKNGNGRLMDIVGKYQIIAPLQSGEVEIYEDKIPWSNKTWPKSRCSESCSTGTYKNILNVSCCYKCTSCNAGQYSDTLDQESCHNCPENSTSDIGSSQCQPWIFSFLKWSDTYSIVLLTGTGMGMLLLIFSFIFFILHREHRTIKSILKISCFMKIGLMVSFGSVIAFLGRPAIHHCVIQQTMYALGFTLCVSCVLEKGYHTFLTSMVRDPDTQRKLRRLDKPFVIMCTLTVVQVLICILWMLYDPLEVHEEISKSVKFTKNCMCTQGSKWYGFGAMNIYIAVLAVVCFLLAFKGRDEETEPIVFSMLIHLFAWLCFIPVFITQTEVRPIVQVSAIMVSNYGVIFCHFTPKWYKVILERRSKLSSSDPVATSLSTTLDRSQQSISPGSPPMRGSPSIPTDNELYTWNSSSAANIRHRGSPTIIG